MFSKFKSTAAAAIALTCASIPAVHASEVPAISDINVEASYSAAVNSNAEAVFPEITDDIRLAIAERIQLSDDAADPTIRVDIRKIALDGDTIIPDSAEFNEIAGIVAISGENGQIGSQTFPIKIVAATDETAVPEGYVAIAPSRADFYDAMVTAFADNVAEALEDVNTAGTSVSR